MKYLFLALITFSFSAVLHVDGYNYTTIQSAIDDAETGDTVLVYQGMYYENLKIEKSITLTSLAMFDDLNNWYDYESVTGQYEVMNENIRNTIIDGSQSENEDFQSTILIASSEDDCVSPIVMGFTIQGGMGTFVTEEILNPAFGELVTVERMIGGGIFSYLTNAEIHHNQFRNNGGPSVENGGAVYAQTSNEDWGFDNRSSSRCEIEEINVHSNFYRDNDALYGNTFSNRTFTGEINLSQSLFDIYNCPESNVTGVWVDIKAEAESDYSGSNGDLCSMSDDIWVSPEGSNYTGDGTQNNPFKSITFAMEIITPTEENPITIYMDEGRFTPTITGETFPLVLFSNMNLVGEGEELTTIDAQQEDRAISIFFTENNYLSGFTILNGFTGTLGLEDPYSEYPDGCGGGILIWESEPHIENISIQSSFANSEGGGMSVIGNEDDFITPILNYISILNNSTTHHAGGFYIKYCNSTLTNFHVSGNQSHDGGGIVIDRTTPIFDNFIIENNFASNGGGGILNHYAAPLIRNSVIKNNVGTSCGAGFLSVFPGYPVLYRVEVSGNSSSGFGGGVCFSGSAGELINTTIVNNSTANWGGGILSDGADIIVTNSIIWENFPNSYTYSTEESLPIISHSTVESWDGGPIPGEYNIISDPLFFDASNNDYSLQENSPCIDGGTADLDGDGLEDMIGYYGTAPDMGAYEFNPIIPGDINGDLNVNIQDIILMVNSILGNMEFDDVQMEAGDLNIDGFINITDILLIINIIIEG